MQHPLHHHAHHHVHHKAHARVHHHKKLCPPDSKAKHIKHVRHVKPHKLALTPVEKNVVLDQPGTLQPPPQQFVAPPPVAAPPPVVDPCATGHCAPSCETNTPLDIKGPCGDPGTSCVERISFNEDGVATKAVLEAQTSNAHSPYFEVEAPKGTQVTGWDKAARNVVLVSNEDTDDIKVSLVVPLVKHVAAALAAPVLAQS